MKNTQTALFMLLSGIVILAACSGSPGLSQVQYRASRAIKENDKDDDGKISRDEWRKRPAVFKIIDTDKDGYLSLEELRVHFSGPAKEGLKASPKRSPETGGGRTTRAALDRVTLCAIGRGWTCDMKHAIARGLFETGLRPRFPENVICHDIDEEYAISYTHKRNRESYHGGIDMPAPWGTPIIAAAAGTVVGKFLGENTPRGIEIVLRHSPEDTGIPLWIYTQYTHFDEMPTLAVGQRVRMGEILGPTGNTGINVRTGIQSRKRRPAIHFGVFYSTSELYVALRRKIIPVNGHWMDPVALFRKKLPLDSYAMKALPEEEKQVPISYMLDDGEAFPANTKIVWPYTCTRR
ncbi:MAG: peptidoglycan DD-metalloendopeptidase family protein [Candidatus Methylomirabilia bacterium]